MRHPLDTIARYGLAAVIGLSLAACAQTPAAKREAVQAAAQWQSVAVTDHQEAFVDTVSMTTVAGFVEARTKQNFGQPQPSAKAGKTYRSALNTYRFDCAERRLAMKELVAYEGPNLQGAVVQRATSNDRNLRWLDAPSSTVFGEMLDFACGRSR